MKDQMNESGPQHNLLDGNEDKSMPKAVTKKAGAELSEPTTDKRGDREGYGMFSQNHASKMQMKKKNKMGMKSMKN